MMEEIFRYSQAFSHPIPMHELPLSRPEIIANPTRQTVLTRGNLIGMIGEDDHIRKAKEILNAKPS